MKAGKNDIQKLLPMHAQLLRGLALLLRNPDRVAHVASELQKEAEELEKMADWQDINPEVTLYSENLGGNLHEATRWINQMGVAEYVLHLHSVSGSGSIAILRLPKTHKLVVEREERKARYAAEQKARKDAGNED